MKRAVIYFIEIIVCYVLQSSLYQFISLANVMPNLLLILVVSIAYMRGKTEGMITGFFSGLLVDIQFGSLIGLYALLMMIIGYVAGFTNIIYSRDDYTLPMFFIAIADFVYQFLYYIVEFLIRGRLDFPYYLRAIILPEMIYTVAAAVIEYKLLHMINNHLDRKENEEE